MLFKTDIKKALIERRDSPATDILSQVTSLFAQEEQTYTRIESRLALIGDVDSGIGSDASGELFSLEQIRAIAIRYDLRYLDSSKFKGNVPFTALQTIKRREREMGEGFKAFRILAPGELFQLEDENADPLLFGHRSDGRHELIAQWGGDISAARALLTYPKRNVLTLVSSVILLTLLLVGLIPSQAFHLDMTIGHVQMTKAVFFFFLLTFMGGLTAYVWFAFRKQFSSQSWNSSTF